MIYLKEKRKKQKESVYLDRIFKELKINKLDSVISNDSSLFTHYYNEFVKLFRSKHKTWCKEAKKQLKIRTVTHEQFFYACNYLAELHDYRNSYREPYCTHYDVFGHSKGRLFPLDKINTNFYTSFTTYLERKRHTKNILNSSQYLLTTIHQDGIKTKSLLIDPDRATTIMFNMPPDNDEATSFTYTFERSPFLFHLFKDKSSSFYRKSNASVKSPFAGFSGEITRTEKGYYRATTRYSNAIKVSFKKNKLEKSNLDSGIES